VWSGWRRRNRWAVCESVDIADMVIDAGDGSSACSSAAHRQVGARWDALLGYLTTAGLCQQQLRDVQCILVDISFRDIDISIWRMDGAPRDLTISCYMTVGGLKKRIAGEWAIHASSLQLAIGSTCLRDSDVIGEFVSFTDGVVTAVVSGPRALQDRDEFTEVNDEIRMKLETVARYMDDGQHQHLMMLWEQSCQWAQDSCQAAASALARLSSGSRVPEGDRTAKETVKDARREIRDVVVKRVQGWQVSKTLDNDKMRRVFQRLASEAGWEDNTVSQLMHSIRRLAEEQYQQHAVRRLRQPTGVDIRNVAGGPHRGW
jgi:hypothetical protein